MKIGRTDLAHVPAAAILAVIRIALASARGDRVITR
jgi:hypothetical protein